MVYAFHGKIHESSHPTIGHGKTSCVFIDVISTTKEFLTALISACSVSELSGSCFPEKWRPDQVTLLYYCRKIATIGCCKSKLCLHLR